MVNKHDRQQQGGQVLVIGTVLFVLISLAMLLTISSSVVRSVRLVHETDQSVRSYVLAESLNEDIVYRFRNGMLVDDTEAMTIDNHTATADIDILPGGGRRITVTGDADSATRRVETVLQLGAGASFNFGIQSGKGGIHMQNTSSVRGNAFSNGPITGANSNITRGSAISAGPDGLINGIHATSSAYAHTIKNSLIEGDAYYQVDGGGNEIWGDEFPGSEDQATSSLPISDEQIEEWESDAEAGGTYGGECPYIIEDTQTIGPIVIPCDLEIRQSTANVSIAGSVWVQGDFITDVGQPIIKVDSSLGTQSVVIIADNPSDRETSSQIELRNAVEFQNSGTPGSYIVLISQNNSAENGGSESGIAITQAVEGDILVYAGHGEIAIAQSASLREVTAYRISLSQSAEVIYESGLASLLFTTGPSGQFSITSWDEIE